MLHMAFSLVGVSWGLRSSCDAWASRCGGFSCWRTWALWHTGFRGCSMRAQWLGLLSSRAQGQQLWCKGVVAPSPAPLHAPPHTDLPSPGIEPVSPALAVRFFTIESPGKPPD